MGTVDLRLDPGAKHISTKRRVYKCSCPEGKERVISAGCPIHGISCSPQLQSSADGEDYSIGR